MNVLIMAQGKATRFPGKHFALVNGKPIIQRTIQMVKKLSPESTITVVGHDAPEYRSLGCALYSQIDPGDGIMTGLFNTKKLWSSQDTVILLGDVVFSRQTLSSILNTSRRLAFFGRTGANRFTGCKHGEIFGMMVHGSLASRVHEAMLTPELRMYEHGRLWGLKHHLSDRAGWVEIDDWTDDVDTREDLHGVQHVLDSMVTCIITCKGRLEHLQLTLPDLIKELDTQRVVVDYDCPDNSGAWALEQQRCHVEFVKDRSHFHKTKALNIGARAALRMDTRWLCFMDTDTLVQRGFVQEINTVIARGPQAVAFAAPHHHELLGFLLVSREMFKKVGGFDEQFEGWGYEDVDMRLRLLVDGGAEPGIVTSLYAINHSQEMRVKHSRLPYKVALEKNRALFLNHLAEREGKRPPGFAEHVERWLGKDLGK